MGLAGRNRYGRGGGSPRLDRKGEAAERYAEDFGKVQIEGEDDETLIARLREEFVKASVDVSAHRIRRKFEAAMNDAIAEIEADK